jgi:hypothetical protein
MDMQKMNFVLYLHFAPAIKSALSKGQHATDCVSVYLLISFEHEKIKSNFKQIDMQQVENKFVPSEMLSFNLKILRAELYWDF